MSDWRDSDLEAADPVPVPGLQRNASGKVARIGSTRPRRYDPGRPPVKVAMNAIIQMEVAIAGALVGRRPHAASWGKIPAADFLDVVQVVTTFVLSRFATGNARPFCAAETFRYKDDASMHCFARQRSSDLDGGGRQTVLVGLAQAGDVGWRRCALFWARELMHARTARTWLPPPLKQDRQQRQRAALERQCDTGIEWLAARVNGWPKLYREQRWRDWRPPGGGHCHL